MMSQKCPVGGRKKIKNKIDVHGFFISFMNVMGQKSLVEGQKNVFHGKIHHFLMTPNNISKLAF